MPAVERPIYSTKLGQEPERQPLPLVQVGCATLFAGGFFGVGVGLIWGPQAGAETAIGVSGFVGGIIFSINSFERAEKFAKEGRGKRAYLEALRGSFEAGIGLAIAGATAGQAIGEVPGALIGGGFGAFVGIGGFGQFAVSDVSNILKQRDNQLTSHK